MVDDCKNVLPVVTSNIGTLLVDCIMDVVPVLDFENDVSTFGVTEAEPSALFVVLVSNNDKFEVV